MRPEVVQVEALRKRAAEQGRSTEDEHRAVLRASLLNPSKHGLKQHLLQSPTVGGEASFDLPRRTR